MTVCEYKPGLEGVPAAESSISHVDGLNGVLEYRGISIQELAQKVSNILGCPIKPFLVTEPLVEGGEELIWVWDFEEKH